METISVLVVEDEQEFLRAYCEAITREPGFRLVGAVTTLAAALALIEQSVPDVLVVDLGLPDGNGLELIRAAAAQDPPPCSGCASPATIPCSANTTSHPNSAAQSMWRSASSHVCMRSH